MERSIERPWSALESRRIRGPTRLKSSLNLRQTPRESKCVRRANLTKNSESLQCRHRCGPHTLTPLNTFLTRPQNMFLRKALFQIHLWTGVAVGLYLVVVCVTGSALVFRIYMQRATFPHLFTAAAGEPADAATVLERLKDAFPNDRISGIDAPTSARPTTLAYVVRGETFLTILLEPTTGRVLGELPERSIVRTIQELHFDLLGGRTGRMINGAGAVLLLLLCATGLVIWWPGIATWRRGFTIDFRRSWRRVIWELHSAVGIWTVALIAMWAATGVYFVWPSQFRNAVNAISPLTVATAPASNAAGASGSRPSWHELIDRAQQRAPGQYIQRVVLPSSETGTFLVMFSPVRPAPAGREALTPVYLDQYTGDVLIEQRRQGRSAGDTIMDWVAPLHVGSFGGNAIRTAWLILGVAPPLLFVTGFIMWWSRVVRPRWLTARRSSGESSVMNLSKTRFVLALALLGLSADAIAQSSRIELQLTGEHRPVNGDTLDSAHQVALADVRRQAVRAAVKTLSSRADVTAIKLSPIELDAYVSALIEFEETPVTSKPAVPPASRVNMRASLDLDGLAQRMSVLKKDDEAATLIVRAWIQSEELQQRLASQRGEDRLRTLTTINANRLVARGALALARTELVTVGGRAPSDAGRRRAKELADAALALAPDSPEVQTLLGNLFTDAEDPVAAEGAYRRALAGLPGSAAARTKLAEALRLQGKFDEAMTELREVIRSDATYAQAHSDLGMILRAEKKIPEAIASYREAIRLDPLSTDAHNGLAVTLAGAEQPEEAVTEFQAIVAIDPDSTIGYYNLAIVLAGLDRDIEAAAALRQVIRINPNHYNAHYNLGEMLRLEGKFDDSAVQFKEYLRLAPDTPQNRRNITRAKQFVEQFTNPSQ